MMKGADKLNGKLFILVATCSGKELKDYRG